MCWTSDVGSSLMEAERDLTVYKLIEAVGFPVPRIRSFHIGFEYDLRETYYTDMERFDSMFDSDHPFDVKGEAFHSWMGRQKDADLYLSIAGANRPTPVPVRCSIPKGSSWSINGEGEIISSAIRIDAIHRPDDSFDADPAIVTAFEFLADPWP